MASDHATERSTTRAAIRTAVGIFIVLLCASSEAHASLLSPELEDKLANVIALVVLVVVPVVLIVLFWMVHILPERIAHKRHHPQFEAIRTLCLLSLVFGGLLWPLAWLWAYSKPVLYRMAYGTDRQPDAMAEAHGPVEEQAEDRQALMEGPVSASELMTLRARLEALETKFVRHEAR